MPVTVVAPRVGWPGSITILRRHAWGLRPLLAPVGPADRLEYDPGDQCQCDLWFSPVKIPLGGSISAEHGVGRMKADQRHLSRTREEIMVMNSIKRALDPAGIMNTGVLIR